MISIKHPNNRPLTNTILTLDMVQIAAYLALVVIAWVMTTFLSSGGMGGLIYVLVLQLLVVLAIVTSLFLVVMNLVAATKETHPRGKNTLYAMSLLFLVGLLVPYSFVF